jgi:hypothetical protein
MWQFARTLARDINAVKNAITEPWSSGQAEGQINPPQDAQARDVPPSRHRTATSSYALTRGPVSTKSEEDPFKCPRSKIPLQILKSDVQSPREGGISHDKTYPDTRRLAAAFGETTTDLELQPSGLYKPVTRFAEFVNIPELIAMFRDFADVVLQSELRQNLKLPKIAGGQRRVIAVPASPA